MTRREFSASVRKAAWSRCDGRCEGCGVEFTAANPPEYDHGVEDYLGGEPTPENCIVLGRKCCHAPKTANRAPVLAKVRRIDAKAAGTTGRKAVIPGSKGSGLRKRMDGTVWRE
jgi:hypothetical protein